MALSIVTYTGDGTSKSYALNFALGILSRDHVKCRVGTEVDGLGQPSYRTISWVNDGLVNISGANPGIGVPVVFTRTVPKDTLMHDYENGAAIEESNLDESNKQNLMAMHEFLDGRFDGFVLSIAQINEVVTDPGFQLIKEDLEGPNNIGAVAAQLDDIEDVAAIDADITTVANNLEAISGAADVVDAAAAILALEDELEAVGAVASDIPTVAGVASSIPAVAAVAPYMATVAFIDDEIVDVAQNISAVVSAQTNLAAIIAAPAAATLADQWANEAEDVEVTTGKYSAYHWSQKASGAALGNITGLSVKGNPTNSTAAGSDITAASDHQVLRRSGTALGFGAINLAESAAVTGILGSSNGGTANAFMAFAGPASSTKTYTLPNATCSILTTNAAVTVPQGGTGVATITGIVKGNGTSNMSAATAGTDYVAPGTKTSFTKQQNFAQATLTSTSNSIAWNLDDGQTAVHTFTENTTLANPTNMVAGATYMLKLIQHASSPKTLAYGSAYKFPGGTAFTVSNTNNAVDILSFYCDGTNMYAVGSKAFA